MNIHFFIALHLTSHLILHFLMLQKQLRNLINLKRALCMAFGSCYDSNMTQSAYELSLLKH